MTLTTDIAITLASQSDSLYESIREYMYNGWTNYRSHINK